MKQLIYIILLFLLPLNALAQYNPQFSQLIKTLEFINPGYNASKDAASTTLLYRNKWLGFEGSPETFALNLNVPVNKWHAGFGSNAISQRSGLVSQTNIDLTGCVDVKVSNTSYMAFGLSVGTELKRIDMERAVYIDQLPFLASNYNANNMHTGIGLNYFSGHLHLGSSLHYSQLESNLYEQNELYSFYLNGSYLFELNDNWQLKPATLFSSHGGFHTLEYGCFILYKDIIWSGISHRIGEAVILFADFKITDIVRLGYSFDIGLQSISGFTYGSHELRLEFTFPKVKKGFNRLALNH